MVQSRAKGEGRTRGGVPGQINGHGNGLFARAPAALVAAGPSWRHVSHKLAIDVNEPGLAALPIIEQGMWREIERATEMIAGSEAQLSYHSPRVDENVHETQRHALMRREVTKNFRHAISAGPEAAKDVACGVGNARCQRSKLRCSHRTSRRYTYHRRRTA